MVVKSATKAVAINGAAVETLKLLVRLPPREKRGLERMLGRILSRDTEERRFENYAKEMAAAEVHAQAVRALNCGRGEEYRIVPELVEEASREALRKIKAEIETFLEEEDCSEAEEGIANNVPERRRRWAPFKRSAKRQAEREAAQASPRARNRAKSSRRRAEQDDAEDVPRRRTFWEDVPEEENPEDQSDREGPSSQPQNRQQAGQSRRGLLFNMDLEESSSRQAKTETASDAPGKQQRDESEESEWEGPVEEEGTDCTGQIRRYIPQLQAMQTTPMSKKETYRLASIILVQNRASCTNISRHRYANFAKDLTELMHNLDSTDAAEARKTQDVTMKGLMSSINAVKRKQELFEKNYTALRKFQEGGPTETGNEMALAVLPGGEGPSNPEPAGCSSSSSSDDEPDDLLEAYMTEPFFK